MQNDYNDVVISSRIRLARNIEGLPFPHRLDAKTARSLPHDVFSSIKNTNERYYLYRMAEMGALDGGVLKEKHLISDDLLVNRESGAVIINESETVSIMLNEEDHIREQCIMQGLSLDSAFNKLNTIDDAIASSVRFSFGATLGYLTACPTNLGTGMRASAMVFLPGLSIHNSLEACLSNITRLNMTIRGVFGEGSDASGYIYQVSNQRTLGINEQQIIESVSSSIAHLAETELKARDLLKKHLGDELKDKIFRAYGILTNAYKLGTKEFMELFAFVRLGIYYGYFIPTQAERISQLITSAQPCNIASLSDRDVSGSERDILRAAFVSKVLKNAIKL